MMIIKRSGTNRHRSAWRLACMSVYVRHHNDEGRRCVCECATPTISLFVMIYHRICRGEIRMTMMTPWKFKARFIGKPQTANFVRHFYRISCLQQLVLAGWQNCHLEKTHILFLYFKKIHREFTAIHKWRLRWRS